MIIGYRTFLNQQLKDWLTEDIKLIIKDMVIAKFRKIPKGSGEAAADNAVQFLCSLYNYAAGDGEDLANPADMLSKKKLWFSKNHRQRIRMVLIYSVVG